MKIKMTENSIKEIRIVNSTIQCIQDTCPFPLNDTWKISDGIKNGKKFEIDGGLYPHELDVFEDFETDKITLGLSISTCSRMNCKGDYVRYPKEYEMGKACVLEEVLLENLRELKPQLKYFTIDIDDYGLEDDGDNGWEHWMGFVLIPIKSAFEAEEKQKRHELHARICDVVENMLLTEENIKKLLKFDNEISGRDRVAKISNNKIYDYGKMKNPDYIDDTIPCSMTFKEYLNHFYASSCWGIEGYGYDEKDADTLSREFDNLELKCKSEIETLNKEDLVNKLLDEADIERMEQKGWIGSDKSFKENSGHFNDVFLATIWEDDIINFWNAIVDEATKRYLDSVSMKKEEETREEIIDKIMEVCEEDTTLSAVKKLCEWLVNNSKHIRRHLLDVDAVQLYINEQIHTIGGIYLYSEKDADGTIIDLQTWAYYEKKGQGDNFSKEELKELYEKL